MGIIEKVSPYLKLTNNERRGFLVVVILLIVVILIKVLVSIVLSTNESVVVQFGYDTLEFQSHTQVQKQEYRNTAKVKSTAELKDQNIRTTYQKFDPNTSSQSELRASGFSSRVANNIVKYRNRGGVYSTPQHLYKIYGVDSSYTELISKYCNIDTVKLRRKHEQRERFNQIFSVELNTADTLQLERLPGIGKVLSVRIYNYRNKLGGFYNVEQLNEVYGITGETIDKLVNYIEIDTSQIIKLNVNVLSEKELQSHPYLTAYQSRAIIKYREWIGEFTEDKQLVKNYILSKEEFVKIQDYLITE